MKDFKLIKDSAHMPDGVRKIQDGKLFIDVEIIKSFMYGLNCVDIEYFDGTRITWYPAYEEQAESEPEAPLVITEETRKIIDHLQLLSPVNINEKFLKEYGDRNWFEEDLKLLERDKELNPKLYEFKTDEPCQNT